MRAAPHRVIALAVLLVGCSTVAGVPAEPSASASAPEDEVGSIVSINAE